MLRFLALLALPLLAACLPAGDTRHPIQRLLEGRTVTYDLPRETDDYKNPPDMAAEVQTWAADGTTVLQWRPLLVKHKTYPKTGRWWIKGDLYCQWFNPEPPPADLTCMTVRAYDNGTRVHFREPGIMVFFRRERHGTFSN
ncbi:hypothetical protein E7681_00620 [Thalassobius vesicularis]|uniref:Lipoprotein n=1 Tax=Thalassobius vesicularis TaxID=1294297 RepID=A0A4S3MD43_9RHOB|nr:hypothetical protein [Thalassobius vesicularis]THD76377.1 hypothetical protein E7681_00620 [Thalassobius vesicularis]